MSNSFFLFVFTLFIHTVNSVIKDQALLPVFDNLYLDMNGIIHACSHPEGATSTPSERDMLLSIFAYVDRIVKHIVRPQKVLFIAVDGVAPRAKLNQQRSRRFAAAKESARSQGDEDGGFDRNCITPGTAFMARIGDKLRGYIRWKMGQDAAWSRLRVVYSGANVPGEGEHKIMQYIRAHRDDGNTPTRHCRRRVVNLKRVDAVEGGRHPSLRRHVWKRCRFDNVGPLHSRALLYVTPRGHRLRRKQSSA